MTYIGDITQELQSYGLITVLHPKYVISKLLAVLMLRQYKELTGEDHAYTHTDDTNYKAISMATRFYLPSCCKDVNPANDLSPVSEDLLGYLNDMIQEDLFKHIFKDFLADDVTEAMLEISDVHSVVFLDGKAVYKLFTIYNYISTERPDIIKELTPLKNLIKGMNNKAGFVVYSEEDREFKDPCSHFTEDSLFYGVHLECITSEVDYFLSPEENTNLCMQNYRELILYKYIEYWQNIAENISLVVDFYKDNKSQIDNYFKSPKHKYDNRILSSDLFNIPLTGNLEDSKLIIKEQSGHIYPELIQLRLEV